MMYANLEPLLSLITFNLIFIMLVLHGIFNLFIYLFIFLFYVYIQLLFTNVSVYRNSQKIAKKIKSETSDNYRFKSYIRYELINFRV